jgi:hypothetical protein
MDKDFGAMEKEQSNDFWSEIILIIDAVCEKFDKQWRKRKRILDTKLLVSFILKLVISKNNQGYSSTLAELWNEYQQSGIELPQATSIAASSFCEARQKLPEEIFYELSNALVSHWESKNIQETWMGHKIFGVDGSKINLPRGLLANGYKIQNEKSRHYPMGLASCLYNLREGMIRDFTLVPHGDERACALEHMNHVNCGDIIVFDRGYFSYLLLYKSLEKGFNNICRMQSGTVNKKVQEFWDSDATDVVIDYSPSASVKSELKKKGFPVDGRAIPLRLIKYRIGSEIYVYSTTLMKSHYPQEDFAELYHGRWAIEELYKISKSFINVEDFHSQTERGVKQELYAHFLLINIARFFEQEAQKNLPPSSSFNDKSKTKPSCWQSIFYGVNSIKINFKNCLLIVARHIKQLLFKNIQIQQWLPKVIISIARIRQKIRPNRSYPRQSFKPRNKWQISSRIGVATNA